MNFQPFNGDDEGEEEDNNPDNYRRNAGNSRNTSKAQSRQFASLMEETQPETQKVNLFNDVMQNEPVVNKNRTRYEDKDETAGLD